MDRDVAIRIDGMTIGAIAYLDSVAHYMKRNLTEPEYKSLVRLLASAMADAVELSATLHRQFPDIVPIELTAEYTPG